MGQDSSAKKMRLIRGNDTKDAEIARLKERVEELQERLDEVTSYYRGELESSQQRLQQESVRSQANEVARRRRAEEQVAFLKAELKAAQSVAEHSKRRYDELSHRLEEMETSAAQQARVEVDKERSAASEAWKSAEEEVERLDTELGEVQRKLVWEQERRSQLEESLKREKDNAEREKHKFQSSQLAARQAVGKLRRALKVSEQRRKQLDRHLEERKAAGTARQASAAEQAAMERSEERLRAEYASITEQAPEASEKKLPEGDDTVYLDLGNIDLGSALKGDLSPEFMMLSSDDSIYGDESKTQESGGEAKTEAGDEFVVDTETPDAGAETPKPAAEARSSAQKKASPEPGTAQHQRRAQGVPELESTEMPPRQTDGDFGGSAKPMLYAAAGVGMVAVGIVGYLMLG